jgi:hypothetical protein
MNTTVEPILSSKNSHERDKNLVFDEPTHQYTILTDPDSKYTSVTTWNHSHFSHFDADDIIKKMMKGRNWNPDNKYWGKTGEEIKAIWTQNGAVASSDGTKMHFFIEYFMNQDMRDENDEPIDYTQQDLLDVYDEYIRENITISETEEWNYFLQFARAFPNLKPYRTEWMVYDEELKLAGSIDMVYDNGDGTLSIYDWKRAKEITKTPAFKKYAVTECINHLPDTNYWHYSLQLNTYKAILEKKYGKKVTQLFLVRLHPDNPKKTFELLRCADLGSEIADLFEHRKRNI